MKPFDEKVTQQLLAPFQMAEVRIRTEPYVAAYVTARGVMTRLREVLPGQWSFRLGDRWTDENGVLHQDGCLVVKQRSDDGAIYELEFHDRGSWPKDGRGAPKQAKAAVSDALKRCAVHVGIADYLYELSDVKKAGLTKGDIERALAAVGYHGAWDERHWGKLGGKREADNEDDEPGEGGVEPYDKPPAADRRDVLRKSTIDGPIRYERNQDGSLPEGVVVAPPTERRGSSNGAGMTAIGAAIPPDVRQQAAAAAVKSSVVGDQPKPDVAAQVSEAALTLQAELDKVLPPGPRQTAWLGAEFPGDPTAVPDRDILEMVDALRSGKPRLSPEWSKARRAFRSARALAELVNADAGRVIHPSWTLEELGQQTELMTKVAEPAQAQGRKAA